MTEKDRLESDSFDEEGQWGNPEFLISQINPNVEERDMLDAFLLVKAAGSPTAPLEMKIDWLGQAIYLAFQEESKPTELEQWINSGVYLARQQLLKRVNQLGLNPALVDMNPIAMIGEVYKSESEFYYQYKVEAYRISQLYFYYGYSHIGHTPGREIEDDKANAIFIAQHTVNLAYLTGCYNECLTLSNLASELFEEIQSSGWLNSQPDDKCQGLKGGVYLVGYNASKAAMKLGRYSEALDWAKFAEPYTSFIDLPRMISEYYIHRGKLLLEMGTAEEALKWFDRGVTDVPGMTRGEINDARREQGLARYKISGDISVLLFIVLDDLAESEDVEALKALVKSHLTGDQGIHDLPQLSEILERALSPEALEKLAQNTALTKLPGELADFKRQLIVLFARGAVDKGDFPKVENLIPEIEQLAQIESPAQLEAALFLVRYRQINGESITWESMLPLVSQLLEVPQTLLLNYLLDLSSILIQSGRDELYKASDTIAALLNKISFDEEDARTPTAVLQDTAISMDIINAFLTLLVEMAFSVPEKSGWWLENVSRFKYLASYRGQRYQKESELFRYSSELPAETVHRIANLAETLTRHSLNSKETGDTEETERQKIETELMSLLYPLFNKRPQYRHHEKSVFHHPEIIHIETSSFYQTENHEAPVISAAYTGGNWQAYYSEEEIEKHYAKDYLELLKKPIFLEYGLKVGVELRKVLLPIFNDSTPPPLIGVRSTGYYHRIPLDTLPLSIDETTGEVTRWVGEKTVSVLLTGKNSDLEILDKQLSLEKMAVFANSEFNGEFRRLGGAVKEAEAIKNIMKTKTGTAMEVFLESDSNRSNFLRLSGGNAPQVLHISTHGIVHEENPSSGFIVLSNENPAGQPILGAVGYHDIMLMDLRPCDLVVLSACSTHEGKSILGEGIMGLAWAFKAAGAGAVIGTRWPVNDEAAVEFWKKFYEKLCAGIPIGKAFLGARQHIMNQEKWKHPYYWGVFQLIV